MNFIRCKLFTVYIDSAKRYKHRRASYYEVVGVSCDVLDFERKIVGIELYKKSDYAKWRTPKRYLFAKIADKAMKFYRTSQLVSLKLYFTDEKAFLTNL